MTFREAVAKIYGTQLAASDSECSCLAKQLKVPGLISGEERRDFGHMRIDHPNRSLFFVYVDMDTVRSATIDYEDFELTVMQLGLQES